MPREAFYATAAQVIPILFLVSLIGETRFRGFVLGLIPKKDSQMQKAGDLMVSLGTLVVMLMGEVAALAALASETNGAFYLAATSTGLGFGFGFVFLSIAEQALLRSDESPAVGRTAVRFVLITFYVLSLASAAAIAFSSS